MWVRQSSCELESSCTGSERISGGCVGGSIPSLATIIPMTYAHLKISKWFHLVPKFQWIDRKKGESSTPRGASGILHSATVPSYLAYRKQNF